MFEMAINLGLDTCFRCKKKIENVNVFSVDHKDEWQSSADPITAYFNTKNIAFSHTSCNANAAQKKRLPHGVATHRGCKCAACIEARNQYNADWMANWRASGKDKSRSNFQSGIAPGRS
jgi:hypothetical protein